MKGWRIIMKSIIKRSVAQFHYIVGFTCNQHFDPLKHGLGGTDWNEKELEIDLCFHGQYQPRTIFSNMEDYIQGLSKVNI